MGSRLESYRQLLRHVRDLGYRFATMAPFAEAIAREETFDAPICLLRNDIDSDPSGAARMFACERKEGIRATYFFRLATIDPGLAEKIVTHGGEVGYHFEEIASTAKRLGLRSKLQIDIHLESIRDEFRNNVLKFGARMGIMPRVVASHGDFINRRIGVPNQYLLTPALMNEMGIVADAYDPRIHSGLDARFSDSPPPQWWRPADPVCALIQRPASISILVHPRQWVCNPALNLRLDALRLWEESAWRWRSAARARHESQAREFTTDK